MAHRPSNADSYRSGSDTRKRGRVTMSGMWEAGGCSVAQSRRPSVTWSFGRLLRRLVCLPASRSARRCRALCRLISRSVSWSVGVGLLPIQQDLSARVEMVTDRRLMLLCSGV